MRKYLSIVACLSFCVPHANIAQDYEALLEKWSSLLPQQKIYIHYDKQGYFAGETVFFKAYLYLNQALDASSTNFFIQLLDQSGHLISEKKYPVSGATASGALELVDSLEPGYYRIRAFTPTSLQAHPGLLYDRLLPVFNANKQLKQAQNLKDSLLIQFFPESGNLVEGIRSWVAYKATNQFGMPLAVEGVVNDANGTEITRFRSLHDGMGKFELKPLVGGKYFAQVKFRDQQYNFPLPPATTEGLVLAVEDEPNGKMFMISRMPKKQKLVNDFLLVAHQHFKVLYQKRIAFEDYYSVKGHIITDSLPSGIIHFTLFNKNYMPVAERLSFINNGEYQSKTEISFPLVDIRTRAKNTVEFTWPDSLQHSCSVSITDDLHTIRTRNDENIYSRFLLTEDIKGDVYHPSYYFENNSDSIREALDLVMMIHGWSRFKWEDVAALNVSQGISYRDNHYLTLSGKILQESNKQPVKEGSLELIILTGDSLLRQYLVTVDQLGNFRLDSVAVAGDCEVTYAYTNSKKKLQQVAIEWYSDPLLDFLKKANGNIVLPESIRDDKRQALESENSMSSLSRHFQATHAGPSGTLPEVIVSADAAKTATQQLESRGVFAGSNAEKVYDLLKNPYPNSSQSVLEYIRNFLPVYVNYSTNVGIFSRTVMSLGSGARAPVSIFVDELLLSGASLNNLSSLPVGEIALIKYYSTGFVGSDQGGAGGTIAIYTKKAEDRNIVRKGASPSATHRFKGYALSREFYSPDYTTMDPRHKESDGRTTLYWNSSLFSSPEKNKIKIDFFNNDFAKRIRIIIEGIDSRGRLVHLEKIMQ